MTTTSKTKLTLEELGITQNQADRCKQVAAIPETMVEEYYAWLAESEDREFITDGLLDFAHKRMQTAPASANGASRKRRRPSNGPSPTRSRRTKADMQAIRDVIYEVLAEYQPMTVRQVYYQLVSRGAIDKTEAEYKTTVCRLLVEMRRAGEIPYGWIADQTRWMRRPDTHDSLESMLELSQQTYRRALWNDQFDYVEVWLEKDALAGVLYDVTAEWDVPLMVTRGFPSVSFIYSAADAISDEERPVYIYYFGDHDPSGVAIDRFVEKEIRRHAPDCDLTFERVAVVEDQIAEFGLQTRPTKKSDSRAKNFKGESVEVDAINPDTLREICRECITRHIDADQLQGTREIERAERDTLATMIEGMGGAA